MIRAAVRLAAANYPRFALAGLCVVVVAVLSVALVVEAVVATGVLR